MLTFSLSFSTKSSIFNSWALSFTVFLIYLFSFFNPGPPCCGEELPQRRGARRVNSQQDNRTCSANSSADRGKTDDFINVLCSTLCKETINLLFKHISSRLWGRETPWDFGAASCVKLHCVYKSTLFGQLSPKQGRSVWQCAEETHMPWMHISCAVSGPLSLLGAVWWLLGPFLPHCTSLCQGL